MTKYLTVAQAESINKMAIERYSKGEQIGAKDIGLLESALNRPKQSIFLEDAYRDTFSKAGALFESLAKNHAFHNANKRTAFFSLVYFLYINEYKLEMSQQFAEDFVVDVVNRKYDFSEIVEVIKNHSILLKS
jgi:death on curing protein